MGNRKPGESNGAKTRLNIELWGGIECTVNRVGDFYFDQLKFSGHDTRLDDLELFASLGLRKLRYPAIWENVAPNSLDEPDWSWLDARVEKLQTLRIDPILGLVHHGSGPRYTSLDDPDFPSLLAKYARLVAERYPHIKHYTPVNEPLTTARFSGLYGLWYPHGRDNATFARLLLNECKGVMLAMQAIRTVSPDAKLVQTEDLGQVYSTPTLRYQAEFENERRWLTYDLLCGRVVPGTTMWRFLLEYCEVTEAELEWFASNPCPPDIVGINYYVTSERYIDERLERYPAVTHGGNGRHRYADIEAVRVLREGIAGSRGLLQQAWERYGLPMAITEAHLACTREEQLRWFLEAWDSAGELARGGVDVRAVTAWSLLGAYDWNSLLTRCDGFYEPGAFDMRSGTPRPTALCSLLKTISAGGEPQESFYQAEGWWHRPVRLFYPPVTCDRSRLVSRRARRAKGQPLIITGATGTLGKAFARLCKLRGLPYVLLRREQLDIADAASVEAALKRYKPWALVNTAGYVRVDDAESDAERCMRENSLGPAILAEACEHAGIPFITFSSDLVFDGSSRSPYKEGDAVAPLSVYGVSKVEAEKNVLSRTDNALVIRTSAFFGPWDEYNFVTNALRCLSIGQPVYAARDSVVSPTYIPDLVNTTLDLLIDGERGLWHLANPSELTWADLALLAAETADLEAKAIEPCSMADLNLVAPRPEYSALGSERATLMPTLADALERYFEQLEVPCLGEVGSRSSAAAGLASAS